jgi:CRP-like cAMP-binding protein
MAGDFRFKKVLFSANQTIFEEGSEGDKAYLITKGKVEIRAGTMGKHPQALGVRGKGEIIGEMSLLSNHRRIAAAVALTDTEVLAISRVEFQNRVGELEPVMKGVILSLVMRVREMTEDTMKPKVEDKKAKWRQES